MALAVEFLEVEERDFENLVFFEEIVKSVE